MDPRLQRRVQRYGWDRAVAAYEHGWRAQLEPAHSLDARHGGACSPASACSTSPAAPGWSASAWPRRSARRVRSSAPTSRARWSRRRAASPPSAASATRRFERSRRRGAAVRRRDLRCRRLRPRADVRAGPRAGRCARCAACSGPAAGRPRRCGARGATAAGPRSSRSPTPGSPRTSARCSSSSAPRTCSRARFAAAGFTDIRFERLTTTLHYASADERWPRCSAAGPVALAYSRFDDATRRAVHAEYLDSIAAYRRGDGYRVPGEFVVAAARVARSPLATERAREKADDSQP